MINFIKLTIACFTIWVSTALLNALMAGTWLAVYSNEYDPWIQAFAIVFGCTLIFSVPAMFIFWLVLLSARHNPLLFRLLLKTGFIVSSLSSLLLFKLHMDEVQGQQLFLILFIVISSISSIMLHHQPLKSIIKNKNQGRA
ncbi:MAG: hypothetical protein ABIN01_00315 [Ferruginibacter sp.]